MNELIKKRRSVRHFKKEELPDDIVNDILEAGRWAPSPKNRQHWHFVVVRGDAKKEMLILMQKGVERTEKGEGLINVPKEWIADAYRTIHIMQEAPVTIFLVNPEGKDLRFSWDVEEKMREMSDIQAIGAVAQNMALRALEKGVGSLWIGNIFFAYEELKSWIGDGEMVLAMSFGYPQKVPDKGYRKPLKELVTYRD